MFDLTTESLWDEQVRDCYLEGAKIIKTDKVYSDTLYRLVQEIDSDLANKKSIAHRLTQITQTLSSSRYKKDVMNNFTDDELKISEEILNKTLSLLQVANIERNNTDQDSNDNKDNMEDKKERLPNTSVTIKQLYGVDKDNMRGRIL